MYAASGNDHRSLGVGQQFCCPVQARRVGHGTVEGIAPQAGRPTTLSGCRRKQDRSEEHTSELQSRENLVCRLLLEKKKKTSKAAKMRKVMRHTLGPS